MSEGFSVDAKILQDSEEQTQQIFSHAFLQFRYNVVKRVADILLIALSLPVWLPICLVAAVLVRFSSPGPVFYREYRLGQYGKPFRIWKFRSMYKKEEQQRRLREAGCTEAEHNRTNKHCTDPRVTPVGRFLRCWSVDELPQLINVLRGEMALIGPRPIIGTEQKFYEENFQFYCLVRPGLSGLWQTSGRSCLGYDDRVLLDCRYVQEWSLRNDTKILAKTFGAVVTKHGAC